MLEGRHCWLVPAVALPQIGRRMPRYVVLEHELPADAERGRHWDLMLEAGDALRTWALSQAPGTISPIDALPLADHRLAYLTYEGPVSGNRGSVTRWDEGSYQTLEETGETLVLVLRGVRLNGRATLRPDPQNAQRVIFSFESDESTA